MIFYIPIVFFIVALVVLLGLPWGTILVVAGIATAALGGGLAIHYKNEDEMGLAAALILLFVVPGVLMFFFGLAIG